jgi:hypothetical protein
LYSKISQQKPLHSKVQYVSLKMNSIKKSYHLKYEEKYKFCFIVDFGRFLVKKKFYLKWRKW